MAGDGSATVAARPKVRVAFFDSKKYDEASFTEEAAKQGMKESVEFLFLDVQLTRATAANARGCDAVCAFVNDDLSAVVVSELRALGVKIVLMRCAGFDRVDLAACKEAGIPVARVPAYSPYAVAEFAAALLQTVNRKTHRAFNRVREGNFTLDGLVGMDLHGKTVGVVGTGKIGQCFIDIALGFGCKVLCYDLYPSDRVKGLPNTQYVEVEELFRKADVISLHAPLTKETHHLINEKSIALMKQGVIIVNTSRGGLVDGNALTQGLLSKKIGGAGLDVYEHEANYFFKDMGDADIADDVLARLTNMRNVVVSSHQAFLTREALEAIAGTTLKNITEFFFEQKRGEKLTNNVAA